MSRPLLRVVVLAMLSWLSTCLLHAQQYYWSNYAGTPGGPGNADGPAANARFNGQTGIAMDGGGNIIVADTGNHTIRVVSPGGVVTTLAGSAGVSGNFDGTGSAAHFFYPNGMVSDGSGNLYVCDTSNHSVRMVTSAGVVTTVAGLSGTSGTADGTGSAARFNGPCGIAADGSGNLYVADTSNHSIRMVTPAGVVTTLAGRSGTSGTADGAGGAARFNGPRGIAVDGSGNLYVADTSNHSIRMVTPAGVVTTLAGLPGTSGTADGTGGAALFNGPYGIAVDGSGNLYVADTSNNSIRKVTPAGVVSTVAGSPGMFSSPRAVLVDAGGDVFVSDSGNSRIRRIDAGGAVTTVAGSRWTFGMADGTGSSASFYGPTAVAVDGAGNVFVADNANGVIRAVAPGGAVTRFAGSGFYGSANGTGAAAGFRLPYGVAAEASGTVYVADTNNSTIRKITPAGAVTTLAGSAQLAGSADGTGSAARFKQPRGVAVDAGGNVYVADTMNHVIRRVTAAGVVTTFAGTASFGGLYADGTGGAAAFNTPYGLAVDAGGYVYVADTGNGVIRKITPAGVVTTLAGKAFQNGSADGTGSAARFSSPTSVAVDPGGCLYVADMTNSTIRKITPAGLVTTIGGTAGVLGGIDGLGTDALFSNPFGVAVTPSGVVIVADYSNNRVSIGSPPPAVVTGNASATSTAAVISATINPNGLAAAVQIEYGPGAGYGSAASVAPGPGGGLTGQGVSVNLAGLVPGTTYHYRFNASNAAGTTSTADATFTTLTVVQNWKLNSYGSASVADDAAPDGDGITTLMKYALVMTPGTPGTAMLPYARREAYAEGQRLALVFTRDPSRNDIEIDVEAADSPAGPWTAVATSVSGAAFTGSGLVGETDAGGALKNVEVRDVVNMSDATRRFMRIKVTHLEFGF